jgi:hypothetical protein
MVENHLGKKNNVFWENNMFKLQRSILNIKRLQKHTSTQIGSDNKLSGLVFVPNDQGAQYPATNCATCGDLVICYRNSGSLKIGSNVSN